MNNLMTKEELDKWVSESKYVDSTNEDGDGCGNRSWRQIYERDGQLYGIYVTNGHFDEAFDFKKGSYIRGKYRPRHVRKITKTVRVTEYITTGSINGEPETKHHGEKEM
jgi:hypothetical protein